MLYSTISHIISRHIPTVYMYMGELGVWPKNGHNKILKNNTHK